MSWTQTTSYTNLTISAELEGVSTESLTVYLTTQIGPGTTAADAIAKATLSFPGSTSSFTNVALLNLPVLQAGTYYLTLYSAGLTGELAGSAISNPPQIIDPSFTLNPEYFFSGQVTSDPLGLTPGLSPTLPFAFSLTGDVAAVTAVPEPLPGALVGTMLSGFVVMGSLFRRTSRRRI